MSNEDHATRTPQGPSVSDLLDGDRLLTIQEVADRLNIVKKTVQNWISNGTLPAVKLGRDRYVLRSKLQEILERKMREAEEEAKHKQLEDARKRELAWLLEHEREQEWAEVGCPSCFRSTNTSREMRLEGRIFCESCIESGRSRAETKEQIYRQVKVEVDERNRLSRKNLTPWEQEAQHNQPGVWAEIEHRRSWKVIRCGECGRPRAVKIEDLLDPRFIPHCEHDPPFGEGTPSINADFFDQTYQGMQRNISAGLAQFEANERNAMLFDHDPADPLWDIYPCASCGTSTASTPQKALIGGVRCRVCFGKPIVHADRVDAIIRQIRHFHPYLAPDRGPCVCSTRENCPHGYIEIYSRASNGEKELLLSWCRSRPPEEKERLARAYADRVGLDVNELIWLLEDVDDGSDIHYERPLVGPSI